MNNLFTGLESVRMVKNCDLGLENEERKKPEYPEKNLSEQRREPTTNSTHIRRRVWESNPEHIGGRRALSRYIVTWTDQSDI